LTAKKPKANGTANIEGHIEAEIEVKIEVDAEARIEADTGSQNPSRRLNRSPDGYRSWLIAETLTYSISSG
jgi:hypothetical protein